MSSVTTQLILFVFISVSCRYAYTFSFSDIEGYLLKIGDNEKTAMNGNSDEFGEIDKSKDDEIESNREFSKIINQMPTPFSLKHVKDSMDRDTACCMLGQIAGDKGYHCHAKFYSNHIIPRNRNRAHHRKMSFYGRDRIPHFGEKMMHRFEKCLSHKAYIFNRCCHLSAIEKERDDLPHYNSFKRYLYNLRRQNKIH